MRPQYIIYVISALVLVTGVCMIFPLLVSLGYNDQGVEPFLWAIGLAITVGIIGMAVLRPWCRKISINHREAMAIVALGWVMVSLVGALPYIFAGMFENLTDACFESVSGVTTTGASVLGDIEAVPEGLLVWRSMSQWLGGMGFVVLSVALLPFLGVGGMQLYKMESTGSAADKITPRIKDTAKILWRIYAVLTIVLMILLMLGDMNFLDALCHAFSTLGTGGMSTKNASVAAFASPYIDWVITVFMFIGGLNFILMAMLLRGRIRNVFRDSEARFYFLSYLGGILLLAACLYGANMSFLKQQAAELGTADAFRQAAFQVVSIGTTTGFSTADYTLWPALGQAVILIFMFLGGCSGSTAGGIKIVRFVILFKYAYQEFFRLIHPKSVRHLKMNNKIVLPEVISGALIFFFVYIVVLGLAGLVLAGLGLDMATAFSATLSCLGNVGPAFGAAGPAGDYASMPMAAKWILAFCMIVGRLEVFTVLALFVPEFWRK